MSSVLAQAPERLHLLLRVPVSPLSVSLAQADWLRAQADQGSPRDQKVDRQAAKWRRRRAALQTSRQHYRKLKREKKER